MSYCWNESEHERKGAVIAMSERKPSAKDLVVLLDRHCHLIETRPVLHKDDTELADALRQAILLLTPPPTEQPGGTEG